MAMYVGPLLVLSLNPTFPIMHRKRHQALGCSNVTAE